MPVVVGVEGRGLAEPAVTAGALAGLDERQGVQGGAVLVVPLGLDGGDRPAEAALLVVLVRRGPPRLPTAEAPRRDAQRAG
jgi:hypothetical protein